MRTLAFSVNLRTHIKHRGIRTNTHACCLGPSMGASLRWKQTLFSACYGGGSLLHVGNAFVCPVCGTQQPSRTYSRQSWGKLRDSGPTGAISMETSPSEHFDTAAGLRKPSFTLLWQSTVVRRRCSPCVVRSDPKISFPVISLGAMKLLSAI